ncbi:MAG: hypothetical protein JW841_17460 [Deltaproteobacteria bacterium]|nr:hypothetical protein [Deltaproteobacteria bacterium]
MLDLRRHTDEILRRAKLGERMVLTYRGRAVLRLEPIIDNQPTAEDPFYQLTDFAAAAGKTLTNEDIDKIIYDL